MNFKEMDAEYAELLSRCMSGDAEADHGDADDTLCQLLNELGFTKTLEAYGKIEKWYA